MIDMRTCPVCNSPVAPDQNACTRCGFKLVGRTESFQPLNEQHTAETAETKSDGFPFLTITKGPLTGEIFYLDSMPISVGRDPKCDLFLNNMTVSREHALIEEVDGLITVRDMNSLNGTWVDGQIVEHAPLYEGSILQIGTFSMKFSYA